MIKVLPMELDEEVSGVKHGETFVIPPNEEMDMECAEIASTSVFIAVPIGWQQTSKLRKKWNKLISEQASKINQAYSDG